MVAKTTKILMINTLIGSESPKTGNHTQVLNMANGMNIIICRLLKNGSMSHRIWVTRVFLTFVISNRDQKVSNVITTIIVIVPRPALNDLLLIFSNEPFITNESLAKLGSRRWNWKFREEHFWNPNLEFLLHSSYRCWS